MSLGYGAHHQRSAGIPYAGNLGLVGQHKLFASVGLLLLCILTSPQFFDRDVLPFLSVCECDGIHWFPSSFGLY